MKTTHDLDGQHQDVDRTPRETVNHNDRGKNGKSTVRPWCGRSSDERRLKNKTE